MSLSTPLFRIAPGPAAIVVAAFLAMIHVAARLRAEVQGASHSEEEALEMTPLCTSTVPRIVYVYSDAKNTSLPVQATLARNPQFELRLYTPASARDFIHAHCPHALDAFDMVIPHSFKADMFRYCAVYTTGGVYIDDDLDVVVPFDQLTQPSGKLLLIEDAPRIIRWSLVPRVGRRRMWIAFVAAREPKSPVLLCALAVATSNILMRKWWVGTLEITGPEVLSDCLRPGSDAGVIGWYPGHHAAYAFDWRGHKIVHHIPQLRATAHYSATRHHWFTS